MAARLLEEGFDAATRGARLGVAAPAEASVGAALNAPVFTVGATKAVPIAGGRAAAMLPVSGVMATNPLLVCALGCNPAPG